MNLLTESLELDFEASVFLLLVAHTLLDRGLHLFLLGLDFFDLLIMSFEGVHDLLQLQVNRLHVFLVLLLVCHFVSRLS